MSVIRRICGAPQVGGDRIAEKQSPDLVPDVICFILIESHEDQSLVSIKIGVVEQGSQEASSPISGVIDSCIVTIV